MKEKVLGLVSGGIDSPVASVLAARKFEVIPLHFCLYPMSSQEDSLKAIDALRDLEEKMDFKKAIVFPWGGILGEIRSKIREGYACVACRSAMLMTAGEICKREGAGGIVTGESLGQKASQTIENISVTSSMVDVPLLRPLVGMNKREIIALSKEMGIWRADHAGCCLATPSKPRTKARKWELDEEMRKIDLQRLIEEGEDLILRVKNLDLDFEEYLFQLAARFG